MLLRHNWAEAAGSIAFMAVGLAVAQRGISYSVGTITNIGPGFFPFWLGSLLALLGLIRLLALRFETGPARQDEAPSQPFPWLPMIMISVAMVLWIQLLKPLGLIPATMALVAVTSLSELPVRPLALVASAIVLPLAVAFLFIYILQMPLRAVNF